MVANNIYLRCRIGDNNIYKVTNCSNNIYTMTNGGNDIYTVTNGGNHIYTVTMVIIFIP